MSCFVAVPISPVVLLADEHVVALVRLPISVTQLYEVAKALDSAYGPGLIFGHDAGLEGWVTMSLPEGQESGATR